MSGLVISTDQGLYCEAGGFHIDPWAPVERAVVTHAHSDHAHAGCREYLTCSRGEGVLRVRVGSEPVVRTLGYGETIGVNGVQVSLHPAGHVLGSAQVRIEYGGEVWVVSGDYKLQPDPTCDPFELVRCHTFITESTFGLPIYRWPAPATVFAGINDWWRRNRERGWTSMVFTYSLGKAQRLLAGIDRSIGPIGAHGMVRRFLRAYEAQGVDLPKVLPADGEHQREVKGKGMILAPVSAMATLWVRRFTPSSSAMASGWMQVRGARRWRSIDRGFVLSDHADWDALLQTIAATGAQRVGVTHGYAAPLTRWLRERGTDAWTLMTRYGQEGQEEGEAAAAEAQGELLPEGEAIAPRGDGDVAVAPGATDFAKVDEA